MNCVPILYLKLLENLFYSILYIQISFKQLGILYFFK